MRILFLGPSDSSLIAFLQDSGDDVAATEERLDPKFLRERPPEFIVSYGYRHILKKEVLDQFPDRAINLHIALLPWNRGADPNLWSFVEQTPKGVTIHYLDEGIDTGDVIVQKEVSFSDTETLRSSYATLKHELEKLFRLHWSDIRAGRCPRFKQAGQGSFHRARDKEALARLLTRGWDTDVASLVGKDAKAKR